MILATELPPEVGDQLLLKEKARKSQKECSLKEGSQEVPLVRVKLP